MNQDLLAPDMMFEMRILLGWFVGVVITLLWVSAQRRWRRIHDEFQMSKKSNAHMGGELKLQRFLSEE